MIVLTSLTAQKQTSCLIQPLIAAHAKSMLRIMEKAEFCAVEVTRVDPPLPFNHLADIPLDTRAPPSICVEMEILSLHANVIV